MYIFIQRGYRVRGCGVGFLDLDFLKIFEKVSLF